jgi:site-specific recombinase XerD
MEDMTLEEEWLSQILGKSTKKSYAKGMHYFLEFLGLGKCEDVKDLPKGETRVMQFFQWLQDTKALSSNSARARIVPVQSFFTYIERPLKLKHKLPQIHIKIESWRPSLEDLQKIYGLGEISVKAWMSLSRDVPGRMGDMLSITPKQVKSGEFIILSEKEKVAGKAFISEQTRELFEQLESAKIELPRTQRGIDKMMAKACQISGMPKRLNQHLWRKIFISKAIDLGVSEMVWKMLTFKSVPNSEGTYNLLNGSELRTHWEKVVSEIPLESKANGRIGSLEEDFKLFMESLWEIAKPVVEKKRLEKMMQAAQKDTVGLIEVEPMPTDPREGLKLFLRLRREGERQEIGK